MKIDGTEVGGKVSSASSGGAIKRKKAKKKEPERDEDIEDAIATQTGGAIKRKKVRKRSPKKDEDVEEALATQTGGRVKYHNSTHKYLMQNLTGRGGRLDSAECRRMMYHIMKKAPKEVWHTYIRGRHTDNTPYFHSDHLLNSRKPKYKDARADVIDTGGSLAGITHSENGYLQSYDSRFHHIYQTI